MTTDADFTDGDHMHRNGARRYTRFVVDDVILPLFDGGNPR